MTATPASEIKPLRGPVALVHLFMGSLVCKGDAVVDATCGNGNDTVMLAGLAGPDGHVWAFDIQEQAIAETGRRLSAAGLGDRVTLLQVGHEEMELHVEGQVKAVLFNLGYLPGGNRSVITRPETTAAALEQSLKLLAPDGIVILTVYSGHDGGTDEQQLVDGWAAGLNPREYHSWRMGQLNVADDAPHCILVQKAA